MKFFIWPKLNGRVFELLVQYYPPVPLSDIETFIVHGKRKIYITSNRIRLRKRDIKRRRPDYELKTKSPGAAMYFDELKRAIDEWVKKNLDTP